MSPLDLPSASGIGLTISKNINYGPSILLARFGLTLAEVVRMPVRRILLVVFVLSLLGFLVATPAAGQFEWPLPGGTTPSSGEAIDFGSVPVGQTARARYTFKILESSDTSASVTITPPAAPFGLADLPSLSFTLAPGQSITFTVTFTPSQARDYTGQLTVTASCPVRPHRRSSARRRPPLYLPARADRQ